jgi:hypothetical protein
VSMLERRASGRPAAKAAASSPVGMAVPPSFGRPSPSSSASRSSEVQDGTRPELAVTVPEPEAAPGRQQIELPSPTNPATSPATSSSATSPATSSGGPAAALVEFARRVADEHHTRHGRPITRDALRARLGVSNQVASDVLRQIRDDTPVNA